MTIYPNRRAKIEVEVQGKFVKYTYYVRVKWFWKFYVWQFRYSGFRGGMWGWEENLVEGVFKVSNEYYQRHNKGRRDAARLRRKLKKYVENYGKRED